MINSLLSLHLKYILIKMNKNQKIKIIYNSDYDMVNPSDEEQDRSDFSNFLNASSHFGFQSISNRSSVVSVAANQYK